MSWCNPPFSCMAQVIRKIIDERADVLLLYPAWPRHWRGMLSHLRSQGVVSKEGALPHLPNMFKAGARVPMARRGEGHKAPHYRVCYALIIWDKNDWRAPN